MNFQQKVQYHYDKLSECDKYLVEYIENNYSEIMDIYIIKL
ncbi:MurR/RpiR family transcriptional regulator, partial [Staphylococcus equorum]